jgi:hypothetical protein
MASNLGRDTGSRGAPLGRPIGVLLPKCLATAGLALLDHVFGAADRMRRGGVGNAAGDQAIQQHADGGQVQLHRRRGELSLQIFDEGGDMGCLHLIELLEAVVRAPVGKAPRRVEIRLASVLVVDLRGEELQHTLSGLRRRRVEERRY